MVADFGAYGVGEGLLGRQRHLVALILDFYERIAHEQEAVFGQRVEQRVNHGAAVRVEVLGLVAEVFAVVPLAPFAHKAGLKHIDDIGIVAQVRLQLRNMLLHPRQRGVLLVRLAVGKAQHALETLVAQHLHVLAETVEHGRRQRLGLVVVKVVEHYHEALALAVAAFVKIVLVAFEQVGLAV